MPLDILSPSLLFLSLSIAFVVTKTEKVDCERSFSELFTFFSFEVLFIDVLSYEAVLDANVDRVCTIDNLKTCFVIIFFFYLKKIKNNFFCRQKKNFFSNGLLLIFEIVNEVLDVRKKKTENRGENLKKKNLEKKRFVLDENTKLKI